MLGVGHLAAEKKTRFSGLKHDPARVAKQKHSRRREEDAL